jgi:hypothetical protein
MFKYMSVEVCPLFAKTLKVRFTQAFGLDDPLELRPFMDFEGTAAEAREVVEPRLAEMCGTVDAALATMEKQQAKDPNFPLRVPIRQLRKMAADNPVLGQQFMAAIQEHRSEVLDNKRMAVHWEAQWEKFRQALGEPLGIFCLTEDPAHPVMWSHYASQHYMALSWNLMRIIRGLIRGELLLTISGILCGSATSRTHIPAHGGKLTQRTCCTQRVLSGLTSSSGESFDR